MRNILIFIALFTPVLLASCAENGGPGPVDAQKFLATLDGPKVPTMDDTYIEAAKSAEQKGDFQQASVQYQQVLSKHPDNKDAELGLADSNRRMGNYDQAIAVYDDLLKKDPKNAGALEGKGLALMTKGNFEAPTPLFEAVMKEDPHRWKTLNALGILFSTRNLQDDAKKYFEAALKEKPGNPSIMNNLGLSEALNHESDKAIATLHEASELTTPGSEDRKRIDLNLALVYAIAGKLDEAKAIAETYYSGAVLDNNLGLYAHLAKDDQMARDYLNMALTSSKTFYEKAWNNLQNLSGANGGATANDVVVNSPETQPAVEETDSFMGIAGAQPPSAKKRKHKPAASND